MSNKDDIWAEMGADRSGSTVSEGPSGRGPLLAILATLGVGAGLIFAAYQLGQKSEVGAAPLIEAQTAEIRTRPDDAGGTRIANTDNDAFAAIEGATETRQNRVIADAVTVEGDLPIRSIDPAVAVETRDIIRETVDLTNITMKSDIAGEPELDGALSVDRSDELLLAGGAEVAPAVAGASEASAAGDRTAGASDVQTASDSSVVVGTEDVRIATQGVETVTVNIDAPARTGQIDLEATGLQTRIATSTRTESATTANRPVTAADFADGGLEIALVPRAKPSVGPSVTVQRPTVPAARPAPPKVQQQAAVATATAPQIAPRAINRAAPSTGVDIQVQLGAFPTRAEVRNRWSQVRGAHPDLLGQFGYKIMPVLLADGQELHRLRVGPLASMRNAAGLCEALRYRNVDCFVPPNQ